MGLLAKKARAFKKRCRRSYAWTYMNYQLAKLNSNELIDCDLNSAREQLMTVSEKPSGSSFAKNELVQPAQYDLQIIVPAYNVEAYLGQCIESIIGQKTKYKIQVVLIDDGSLDKTGEIADSFTDPRIRVIHQQNKGLSGARNAALKHLNAQYIMFVDSDDWIFEGSIDAMLDVAMEKDAEIVQAGYHCQEGDRIFEGIIFPTVKKVENMSELYGFPWGKIYKSSLWQNMAFPEGFWFEDTILRFLLYPCVNNAWVIPHSAYVYRKNINGITYSSRVRPKCLDTHWITEMVMQEHALRGLPLDAQYQRCFFRQILLNAERIVNMPDLVKRHVFALSCGLYDTYFAGMDCDPRYRDLDKALKTRNYGLFALYAKYHHILFPKK